MTAHPNLTEAAPAIPQTSGTAAQAGEVFRAFFKLGLTSFGGPIAHLGYFRDELVVRRKWIDEAGYADLVALCQFLPGPASSQVSFALGLLRGGPCGAFVAWAAFTLPSAIILVLFAYSAAVFDGQIGTGLLHGLKVVAVAVVAQAVWGMARTLTPDRERASIALAAVLIVVSMAGTIGQIAAIVVGALAGLSLCRTAPAAAPGHLKIPVSERAAGFSLVLFLLLLIGLPVLARALSSQGLELFASFYRTGSLVFGGGHVVLPLLQSEVVGQGWADENAFLAGYGAAQAIPGPLFTFAAYLGAVMKQGPNGPVGALICLLAIFLPGFLLLIGALPFWGRFRSQSSMQAAMRGANAAVVGLLGAALYDPVWTSAILGPYDFALALTGFVMLTLWKASPWLVVLFMVPSGLGLSLLTTPVP
ncbi:chromate efflux transporter [Tianweitania sp. BSSL-BM11]|uniref:Chromate efflux transporter n=1 Tax=Tianweitania aestuarii TaxID=2814886 RepID=A0ABS5RTI1_9HYPH|nr:chromate efflux transporter [Tianweitania aestuarii]MBS9719549.1 chromate efflux transporter [Tianweitania aestuarii]